MRTFKIELSKAEMRLMRDLTEIFLYKLETELVPGLNKKIIENDTKLARRIMFILRQNDL